MIGGEPTCRFVRGQKADDRGGASHNAKSNDECIFTADDITDAPKEQRAEGANQKADSERGQVGDVSERIVPGRVELQSQGGSQASKDIKIVPFNHRADGRGKDDAPNAVFSLGVAQGCCSTTHEASV